MTDSSQTTRTDHEQGFSLFELLIVLVLLAMVAGVATPSIGRFLDNLNFRQQTAKLLTTLNYARLTAITKGRPVKMTIGELPGTIMLSGAIKESRSLELDDAASIVLEPKVIIFSPAGQATPTRLISMLGNRRQVYLLDPLSGRPVPEMAE